MNKLLFHDTPERSEVFISRPTNSQGTLLLGFLGMLASSASQIRRYILKYMWRYTCESTEAFMRSLGYSILG